MSKSQLLSAATAAGTAASSLVLVVGLGSSDFWICDLLANFRIHAAASTLVLVGIQVYLGRIVLAISAGLILALAIILTYESQWTEGSDLSTRAIRVVSLNLGPSYGHADSVSNYLTNIDADIALLQEFSPPWEMQLVELSGRFPHSVLVPRPGSYGLAVYSRYPITDSFVESLVVPRIPFVRASIRIGRTSLDVANIHLLTPVYPRWFALRNEQIEVIADTVDQMSNRTVVCGDWNLTPWSGQYQKLIDAGLDHGRPGDQIKATWPSALGWAGIPIDHCFASNGAAIRSKLIGPNVGSDHRPILVEIDILASTKHLP